MILRHSFYKAIEVVKVAFWDSASLSAGFSKTSRRGKFGWNFETFEKRKLQTWTNLHPRLHAKLGCQKNTRQHKASCQSRLLWQMILRWSVLRRGIRTLHRRQNVPASWENIELSHIHTYTCAGCWLMFLDCSKSNASQWLWRPVWFLQSPGTTFRRVLPVYAFCLNWVQIAESKVVRPTQFIEIRYFAPGVFLCKSSLGGVAFNTKICKIWATQCNSL